MQVRDFFVISYYRLTCIDVKNAEKGKLNNMKKSKKVAYTDKKLWSNPYSPIEYTSNILSVDVKFSKKLPRTKLWKITTIKCT